MFTRKMFIAVVGWLMAAAAFAATPDLSAPVQFNIAPQQLHSALLKYSEQSGVQVSSFGRIVEGKSSGGVVGTLAARTALDQLLKGTGLGYEEIDSRTVAIRALRISSNEAVETPMQRVTAGENTERAPTDGDGADAQEILVTGSRFSDRTVLTSPVPVDIVSAEDLRAGGRTELAESLAAVVPAFNFTVASTAGTANAARPFTYRGLPPNEVLVLVNGKRWHPVAPKGLAGGVSVSFDFNSIPPTAISSVEILRDGAAAQYGSDAIAGVMNIRLREDLNTELSATTTQSYEGDGFTVEAAFDTGMRLGEGGVLHLSTYYRDAESTNRQGRDVRQQYFATNTLGNPVVLGVNSQTDATPVLPAGFSFDPREFTVDRENTYTEGGGDRTEAGVSLNAQLPLSDATTVYGFGGYTYRTVETDFTWRRPMDNNNVRAIYPNGYAPRFDARVSDAQLALGIKGSVGAWDWDLSESYGFNRMASYVDNTLNASLGAASPTAFFSGVQRIDQATTNLDLKRDFDIGWRAPLRVALGSEFRREGFEVSAGEPASYANGGAVVADGPNAGTLMPGGSQGVVGYAPGDEIDVSRNSIAGYIDLENQVTDGLLLTLAGRYEHYSDFGSTINGKFSFRQEFTPWFALRGSASTGFRAPNLYESYFSNTGSQVVSGQFFVNRHFPVSDPIAQALGAQPLEPEESVSYSLGSVFTFGERLSFTVDLYRIFIDDVIIQSSTFNDVATRNFLAARGFTGVSSASFYTNAVDKRVEGVDFTGRFTTAFSNGGRLTLSSGVNFNDPQVTSVDPTPPALAAVTSIPLFNARSIVAAEEGAPRSRFNVSATYAIRNLQLLARATRYGATRELGGNAAITDQTFGAKWITDLEAAYQVNDALRLTLGAQNLFDVYPDENSAANNPAGFLKYPFNFGNAPFGIGGGQYYFRAFMRF